jgi:hypothetical protein
MTVSDGTISTNGVQPLATFLFTLPYLATGGDKVTSLIGIHLIAAAAAMGGIFATRALAARILAPLHPDPRWPWLVAALWFTGPLLVQHTMNALETGIYTLCLLLTLLQLARVLERGAEARAVDRLALGAMLGIVFLARNDAVFLVLVVFAIWGLFELVALRHGPATLLRRVVPAGLLSLVIVLPWLVNNKVRFGSIVPISGTAQSTSAEFGQNLPLLPAKLFETFLPMLPLPGSLERSGGASLALAIVCAALLAWFLIRVLRGGGRVRLVVLAYVAHGAALAAYYGLYFGAPHFLSRYLAPLAPLLITASVLAVIDLSGRLGRGRAPVLAAGAGLAALLLGAALSVRLLIPGFNVQGHFQVVSWIEHNVPDTVWIGAVQTGTLGYWHDRTINLDGKVNPEALADRVTKGHVLDYVVASEIDYLADWNGIASWTDRPVPAFAEAFEVVIDDPEANLGVLARRDAP